MRSRSRVVEIGREWWLEERTPSTRPIVVRPFQSIPKGKMFTPKQIAETLSTSLESVYGYLKAGQLRSVVVGRRYRIPESWLIEFLQEGMERKRRGAI